METDILTSLANKGAIGVVILAVVAIVYIIKIFLRHIASEGKLSRESQAEQARLSRDAHKETAKMSGEALREVSIVVAELHRSNEAAHTGIAGQNVSILKGVDEVKSKLK